MDSNETGLYFENAKVNTEQYCRQKEELYRKSDKYNDMVKLYPILQNSIESCKEDELIT